MKRSAIIMTVAAATVGLALTGCSAGADADDGADAGAGGPLTVWIMGDSGTDFEELVAPWTDETGTEVEVVAIPWDGIDQRLTTAVASDDGPDVLQVGLSKLRTFADAGALLALDDQLADHPGLAPDNFLEGVAGEATAIQGETVSIPWISDTRVLFTRTDILTDNGIDAPPATWEELREDARVLSERGEGQFGYYIPQWDSPLPVLMTWSNGGEIITDAGQVDFSTAEFQAAVDTYTGLYQDGSVPTNSDFDQVQGFVSGVAPMLISGPYLASSIAESAPDLEGSWQVSTVPAGEASATSLFAGSNLAVWHSTDQVDDSLDLLEYLSEPSTQLDWYAATGQLPTNVEAMQDEEFLSDPLVAVYSEQLSDARVLPFVPNWDGETGAALLEALNSIVLNGADRQQTIDTLIAQTEEASVS